MSNWTICMTRFLNKWIFQKKQREHQLQQKVLELFLTVSLFVADASS